MLATILEVGSDVAGVISGIAFAIPTLNTDKLQKGIAAIEADIVGKVSGALAHPQAPSPGAAQITQPGATPDAADALIEDLLTIPRAHLGSWSKVASRCLRIGAGFLVLAFGMKIAFYAIRDAQGVCPAGQAPACEKVAKQSSQPG